MMKINIHMENIMYAIQDKIIYWKFIIVTENT